MLHQSKSDQDLIAQVETYLADAENLVKKQSLPDGRTFLSEIWSEHGYTMFTCRFPKAGLEHADTLRILEYLKSQGVPTDPSVFSPDQVQLITDINDPDLYNLTLVLAEEGD